MDLVTCLQDMSSILLDCLLQSAQGAGLGQHDWTGSFMSDSYYTQSSACFSR